MKTRDRRQGAPADASFFDGQPDVVAGKWALAFSLAAWLALLGNAAIRRLARRGHKPDDHAPRATDQVRSLGGVVVAGAALLAALASPDFTRELVAAATVGLLLALFGVMYRGGKAASGSVRLAVLTVAALVTLAAGVRAAPAAVGPSAGVMTVLWIVLVASAIRRLDHTDGLAPAVAAAMAVGVFSLAGFGNQAAVATLAVAIAGASIGSLAYNLRPASTFLGEGGRLFLGFELGVLTIEVHPVGSTRSALVVPVLLAAVPLLDLATVTLSRLSRGHRLGTPRRDHLYHRLLARGLVRAVAVTILLLAQLSFSTLAVFVGRGVIPAGWGALVAAGLAIAVVVVTVTAPVHRTAPERLSRRVKLAALCGTVVLLLLAGSTAFAAVDGKRLLEKGRASVQAAIAAAHDGDSARAQARFADAARAFEQAHSRLDGPLAWPGLAVPLLAPNLQATERVAGAGADLAHAGTRLASSADPQRLKVVNGTVPLAEVVRITPTLEEGARTLRRVVSRMDDVDKRYLVGPVDDAIHKLDSDLARAQREAGDAVAAAKVAPAVFGGDGSRRYFLAVQNSAELRATGGLIGNWGILTAENGKVRLDRFERTNLLNEVPTSSGSSPRTLDAPADYIQRYTRFGPAQVWQNVNMSPDLPTVAHVIEGLFPQSGGQPVDGVIAVDPVGLQALLQLTGPIGVEGWPVPLTAENVVDVTLRQAYEVFGGNPDRVDFLGDVARRAIDVATTGELGSPARIAQVLGKAAREGHLVLSFTRPEEQALADRLEVSGRVPPVRSDSLMVVTQNAAGNKLDYYLRRFVNYRVRLRPDADGNRAKIDGQLEVRLDNTAPPGVSSPAYVFGPYDDRFVAGENRSFVSIYTPLGFSSAALDGGPTSLEATDELGRNVYSAFVSTSANSSRSLALDMTGGATLTSGGWYALDLVHQPGLFPDQVTMSVEVPPGWRITDAIGLEVSGGNRARGRFKLDQTTAVRVRLAPTTGNLWEQLVDGPEKAASK